MAIEIDQIIRTKRRTLTLIVEDDGSLVVRAPLKISEKMIHQFVDDNALWIKKKRAQALMIVPSPAKRYIPGEAFLYLGNTYILELVRGQKKPLLLEGSFKLAEQSQGNARKVFQEWYRDRARQIISDRVNLFAAQFSFEYEKIRISSARTRWGSCSPSGTISFSWRLITTPSEVVDYVIIHELVHTVVHNHSKRFWKKGEKIRPNYRDYNKWLRKNGREGML